MGVDLPSKKGRTRGCKEVRGKYRRGFIRYHASRKRGADPSCNLPSIWQRTAVFVDARAPEKFKAETIPGAVNVRQGETKVANEDGRLPHG